MGNRYTYDEVLKEFKKKNYILLSKKYNNCNEKLEYLCKKHIDKGVLYISFGKLKAGQGCYYCGRERTEEAHRKDIEKDFLDIPARCEELGFEFIQMIHENDLYYVEFICKKHRNKGIQKMRVGNIRRDIKGCKYCAGKDSDIDELLVKLHKISPHLQPTKKIVGKKQSTKFYCNKHDKYVNGSLDFFLKGGGCYFCGLEKLSELHLKDPREFEEEIKLINPHLKPLEKYVNRNTPLNTKCCLCNNIWKAPVYYLRRKHSGCPNCKKYKGEEKVQDFLDGFKIKYERQYTFDNCKDINLLPFDFYLIDYNVCIEYDGIQHYEPKQIARGMSKEIAQESHLKTVKHDKIKNKYCKDNKIELIRIPYWELENDNLECYLFDRLVELNIIENITNNC